MTTKDEAQIVLRLDQITKRFGALTANDQISFDLAQGEVIALLGENGAGKTTLMNILFGHYTADEGTVEVFGKTLPPGTPAAALNAGVGMVHQHFTLADNMSVLENIVLGTAPLWQLGFGKGAARRKIVQLVADYGLAVDPDAMVGSLTVGERQRVEILKALYRQAAILILDEPTGVLTPAEADQLFRILARLREEGKTIILITHKLREIMEITDTVSVMRRGEMTATVKTSDTSPPELAELMVGRKVLLRVDKEPSTPGDVVLDVKNLKVVDDKGVERLRGINLQVRAGEVVGSAGVAGNGQSELLEVLGGYEDGTGEVLLNGVPLDLTGKLSDGQSRRNRGIAHVPEDRQREGLIMDYMAWENTAFGYHHDPDYRSGVLMNNAAIRSDTADKMERFDVRPPNPKLAAKNFSGGNQQKIVLAREIERNPDLLLIGQPTRGVDIGAIEFIHQQVVALRDQGKAILLVSVELEEILALSDRIAVMFDGQIMGERLPSETDEKELGLLMAGITDTDAPHSVAEVEANLAHHAETGA